MPRLVNKAPKYSKKKRKVGKDRARVRVDGIYHDLGVYGSQESWDRYHELVGEWQARQNGFSQRGSVSECLKAAVPELLEGLEGQVLQAVGEELREHRKGSALDEV